MNAAEVMAFAVRVRSEATASLAKLDAVDVQSLPPTLRSEFDSVRAGWLKLQAMTADDVIDLYLALCESVGRELTADDVHGLFSEQ
jgi:hypothetical protein